MSWIFIFQVPKWTDAWDFGSRAFCGSPTWALLRLWGKDSFLFSNAHTDIPKKNLIHNCRNNLKGLCNQIWHQPDFLKASLILHVYFLFDLLWFKFCIALLLFFIRKSFYSTSSKCIYNFQTCFETPLANCFRGYLWHCCCGAIKKCFGLLGIIIHNWNKSAKTWDGPIR